MNDPSDGTAHQLTLEEYQAIEPVRTIKHPGGEIIFCTPTTTTNWRVEGFFENEPETCLFNYVVVHPDSFKQFLISV